MQLTHLIEQRLEMLLVHGDSRRLPDIVRRQTTRFEPFFRPRARSVTTSSTLRRTVCVKERICPWSQTETEAPA
jgi:hypothetical protein